VAFAEYDWTPAMHEQATDRTHRIGQKNSVTAWYFHADNTIEDTFQDILMHKGAVVAAASDGAGAEISVNLQSAIISRMASRHNKQASDYLQKQPLDT